MKFPIFRATLDLNGVQESQDTYVNMSDIDRTASERLEDALNGVTAPIIQVDMLTDEGVTPLVLGCTERDSASLLTTLRLALEETRRINAGQDKSSHPLGASHLDAEPVGGTAKADPSQEFAHTTGTGNVFTGNDNVFAQFFGTTQVSPEMQTLFQSLGEELLKNQPDLIRDTLAKKGKKICEACKGSGLTRVRTVQTDYMLQTTCLVCGGDGMVSAIPTPAPTDPPPAPATDAAPIPPTNTDGAQPPPTST